MVFGIGEHFCVSGLLWCAPIDRVSGGVVRMNGKVAEKKVREGTSEQALAAPDSEGQSVGLGRMPVFREGGANGELRVTMGWARPIGVVGGKGVQGKNPGSGVWSRIRSLECENAKWKEVVDRQNEMMKHLMKKVKKSEKAAAIWSEALIKKEEECKCP